MMVFENHDQVVAGSAEYMSHVVNTHGDDYFLKRLAPKAIVTTNNTMKMKNSTLAIEAAPAAMPPNPKMPAITAMMKKMIA
jgi:hypothetical protein